MKYAMPMCLMVGIMLSSCGGGGGGGGLTITPAPQPTPVGDRVIVRVDSSAVGGNDGTSWADAYTSLQTAVDNAVSGHEIWVAAGTHKPAANADRLGTFELINGVSLYGGFDGTESLLSERDATANLTTLSGEVLTASTDDNCYHVIIARGNNTIDGFRITGGNANGSSSDGVYDVDSNKTNAGGGIYAFRSDSGKTGHLDPIEIQNCRIENNDAEYGGGLYMGYMNVRLVDCTISQNEASLNGGGFVLFDDEGEVVNCLVADNRAAYYGGGLTSGGGAQLDYVNCTFSNNEATSAVGGLDDGGSPYGSAVNTYANCIFYGNNSTDLSVDSDDLPTIANSCIGTVHSYPASYTIPASNITADPLFVGGGDYHLQDGSPAIDVGRDDVVSETSDLDGNPRQVNGIDAADAIFEASVDMGCYENQSIGAFSSLPNINN